jgi:hypothetical protein
MRCVAATMSMQVEMRQRRTLSRKGESIAGEKKVLWTRPRRPRRRRTAIGNFVEPAAKRKRIREKAIRTNQGSRFGNRGADLGKRRSVTATQRRMRPHSAHRKTDQLSPDRVLGQTGAGGETRIDGGGSSSTSHGFFRANPVGTGRGKQLCLRFLAQCPVRDHAAHTGGDSISIT